jgi:hypothetical protein
LCDTNHLFRGVDAGELRSGKTLGSPAEEQACAAPDIED